MIESIEYLSHFRCEACQCWFMIADAPERPEWWCPWCGVKSQNKPHETGKIDPD